MKLPRFSTLVASVFGIGFFDVAPGTVMSAVAVPLAAMVGVFAGGGVGLLVASFIVFAIGVIVCDDHVRHTGRQDPPECVIDELAGQWLACSACLLPFAGMPPVIVNQLAYVRATGTLVAATYGRGVWVISPRLSRCPGCAAPRGSR